MVQIKKLNPGFQSCDSKFCFDFLLPEGLNTYGKMLRLQGIFHTSLMVCCYLFSNFVYHFSLTITYSCYDICHCFDFIVHSGFLFINCWLCWVFVAVWAFL